MANISVHLMTPAPLSQIGAVRLHVNTPYEIHPVAVPEPGGRLDYLPPVHTWRNWRIRRTSRRLWNNRLRFAIERLQPTAFFVYQDDEMVEVSRSALLQDQQQAWF